MTQDNPEGALTAIESTSTGLLDFFNADHRHEIIRAIRLIDHAIEKEILTKAAAKAIGVSVDLLRKETSIDKNNPKDSGLFTTPEPWSDPVDGGELLSELSGVFMRYAVLPEYGEIVLALWSVHTYTLDAAETSPILAIESPEKRCGKTVVMGLLTKITARPAPASNISPAAIFRVIEEWRPTLLIDEADSFMRDNEEIRGVVNSGHTRPTAYVIRCTGEDHKPARFSTWGAKVIALIGKLAGTIQDRSIVIMMRRKTRGERIERMRSDRDKAVFLEIRRKCVQFAVDSIENLRKDDPHVPVELNDRFRRA